MSLSKIQKSKLIQSLFQLQSIPSIARGDISSKKDLSNDTFINIGYSVGQHASESHRFSKLFKIHSNQNNELKSSFFQKSFDGASTVKVFENTFNSQYTLKYTSSTDKALTQLALYNDYSDENYTINLSEKYIDWLKSDLFRSTWVVELDSSQKYFVGNFEVISSGEHNTSYYWQNNDKKNKFDFENYENWGEQYSSMKMEKLFVWTLDINRVQEDVQVSTDSKKKESSQTDESQNKDESSDLPPIFQEIKGIPEDIAVGQFVFSKDGKTIYFVGYSTKPRRFGLIHCDHRPSSLYMLTNWWDQDKASCKNISEHEWNIISPRITPDGESLIFATTTKVPYHKSCLQLVKVNLQDRKSTTCLDIVDTPNDLEFPGLYFGGKTFNEKIFTSDSKYIICESIWRSQETVIRISIDNGDVVRLETQTKNATVKLLDFNDEFILVSETTPNQPYKILYGKYDNNFKVNNWIVVEDSLSTLPSTLRKSVESLEWSIENIPAEDAEDESIEYFVIKDSSENSSERFLLVPHGGPHSVYAIGFYSVLSYFALNGYTCVVPNYRGSLGFGQNFVKSLPGNCGDYDVKDCYNSLQDAIKKFGNNSKNLKSFVRGGSHGGFLTLSLIAQYPDTFSSAIALNPVVNIATMVTSTDIPDWCYTEVSLDPLSHSAPTTDFLLSAFESSPISLVENIKTPTLLLVGQNDLRVPPSQAREMYYALKSRGVKTQMIFYPENDHPIAKPSDNTDVTLRTIDWLLTHSE